MSDKTIQTINPLTEEVLQTYPIMTDAEANDVVRKSHEAHLEWRLKSLEERAKIIGAIGVIGPTHLNYARIIPMVDYTAQAVSRLLT